MAANNGKKNLLICIIETLVVSISFFIISVVSICAEYKDSLWMFTIDQITTFDHEICDDNGTVYPVGTKFMVREVTLLDDPIISIYVDESDSADGNYSEPLNEFMYAEYPYQVHTDGAIRIDDTENSEELYVALNKAQTDNKKVYIKKGVVRFGISVIVFVVGLALFAVFNCYSNIEQKTKKNIMIGIIFLCVAIVLIIFLRSD